MTRLTTAVYSRPLKMAILDKDSPLRKLLAALNPQQSLFLDGVQYACMMADLVYVRLVGNLLTTTDGLGSEDQDDQPSHVLV